MLCRRIVNIWGRTWGLEVKLLITNVCSVLFMDGCMTGRLETVWILMGGR